MIVLFLSIYAVGIIAFLIHHINYAKSVSSNNDYDATLRAIEQWDINNK